MQVLFLKVVRIAFVAVIEETPPLAASAVATVDG